MKRYGLRSTGETDTDDYFDNVLSRKGAAPATGRDTLIKLQGRVARKLDTHDSENRLAGLPPRITRITYASPQLRALVQIKLHDPVRAKRSLYMATGRFEDCH